MGKILERVATVGYSIWFNFKAFDFKTACKLPVVIAPRVKVRGLKKGMISLPEMVKPCMIRLGLSDGAYQKGKYEKSYLAFTDKSSLVFKGTAHCANHFAINLCGGRLTLGDNFSSNYGLVISCGQKISFGKDVLIGWDCTFIDGDGHDILNQNGEVLNGSRPICVGNHVWISSEVVCLKGVEVADNTVVGFRTSLTSKHTETNSIIAGNPARVVKRNIDWKH